ncbi:MAG: hypothetical protein ACI9Y1_001303 [Lentisphaeria bacterium]|jgi:hypothetical protein
MTDEIAASLGSSHASQMNMQVFYENVDAEPDIAPAQNDTSVGWNAAKFTQLIDQSESSASLASRDIPSTTFHDFPKVEGEPDKLTVLMDSMNSLGDIQKSGRERIFELSELGAKNNIVDDSNMSDEAKAQLSAMTDSLERVAEIGKIYEEVAGASVYKGLMKTLTQVVVTNIKNLIKGQ